jgi:hypothetical protein
VSAPIQFYSCFIVHSAKDSEFVNGLYSDLQAKGVRCWLAPHDIRAGQKIYEQIDEAIRLYDKVLLVLSEASMHSKWVEVEITTVRARETREKRQLLLPISLVEFDRIREWSSFDPDTGKDSARLIREYFIPDFSGWRDHDKYMESFERLLRDLKEHT